MKNTISMTGIYGVAALVALLLVTGYWKLIKNREKWLSYIYVDIFMIDMGYFALSISKTAQGSLLINVLVYLASIFLQIAMLMLIIEYKKRKNIPYQAVIFLVVVVVGNMVIWFVERLIPANFEFLSIFYVFTGGLLLLFYVILEESFFMVNIPSQEEPLSDEPKQCCKEIDLMNNMTSGESKKEEIYERLNHRVAKGTLNGIDNLSIRELEVLLHILDNKKRKIIAEEMEITENTVKKHTTHIFTKLGVTSRKELFEKCENKI